MAVIVFFGLFQKLGGFLMQVVVVSQYGTGQVYDVFTAVYTNIIILFLFSTLLKILLPAFMPLFSELLHTEGEKEAWRFVNTLLNLMGLATLGASALVFFFAPRIVATLLPGFSGEAQTLAAEMLRWMAPGLAIILLAVKAQGIFNSYKVFSYPSAGEATQKMVWVAAIFAGVFAFGMGRSAADAPRVIGLGFVVGCAAQVAVLLFGLRKRAHLYHPALPATTVGRLAKELGWFALAVALFLGWAWLMRRAAGLPPESAFAIDENSRKFMTLTGLLVVGGLYAVWLWRRGQKGHSVMARFARLAAPLMVGILFARYRDLSSAFFQSYTEEGVFGVIEFAKKVTQLPTVLVAYSLSIAMFPFLCDMAARKETESLAQVVSRTLKLIALFFLPLTAVMMVLGGPIMQLLMDRKGWDPETLREAWLALGILSTGVFFMSIENVLMQTFFSLQRTVLPTALGIVFSLLYSVGLYVAIERLGFDSPSQAFLIVCVAYPLPRILKNVFLVFFLHRQIGLFRAGDAVRFGGKLAVICAATAGAAWAVYAPLARLAPVGDYAGRRIPFEAVKAAHCALPSLAALIVFALLLVLLRVEEFGLLVQWVRDRGWRERRKTRGMGAEAPPGLDG